jgi:GAF domain-containing protein
VEPIPETREVIDDLISQGDTEIPALLSDMARRARDIVPELVGLSLGLVDEGLTVTLVATSDEMATLDAVQYLAGGPCVTAVARGETVEAVEQDLLDENEWQLYAKATAAAGVQSSLTLPILRAGEAIGSVNLYASTPDAFEGHHRALATALGTAAEGAVSNADLEFRTRLEAAQGPTRLADRDDVDIAVGLIAGSGDVPVLVARERLTAAAARAGITEGQAARAIRQILAP